MATFFGGSRPSPATNVVGMWDASNFASLTFSTFTNVSSVADGSGGGNTMNKAGSSQHPVYNATGFNSSHPAVVFTGGSLAALESTPFPMGTGNTLTMWYVGTLRQNFSSSFGRFLSYTKPGAAQDWNVTGSWSTDAPSSSPTTFEAVVNSAGTLNTGLTATPAGHRVIVTKKSDGTLTIYVDNVAGTPAAVSTSNWVSGGWMNIGMQHASIVSGNDYGSFAMGECGVSTDYSDATAVAALDAFLKNKWGL